MVLVRFGTVQQNASVHPYTQSTQVGKLNSFAETEKKSKTETC